jgi:ribosome-associated heat shock protein Hsp15
MNSIPKSETIGQSIRIDKWLWFARFLKTRSLATKLCAGNKVRVNSAIIGKSSTPVRIGDVLTFPQADRIRVIRVTAIGTRRGPAPEAQSLYEDLSPPPPPREPRQTIAPREAGSGRPTKADRRALDRLRDPK